MKKNNIKTYEVSETILKSINKLLFVKSGGVDLSPIIDDLSLGADKIVAQLKVGLLMNGLKEENPLPKVIFNYRYDKVVDIYISEGYSMLTGKYLFTICKCDLEKKSFTLRESACCTLDDVRYFYFEVEKLFDRIQEKYSDFVAPNVSEFLTEIGNWYSEITK